MKGRDQCYPLFYGALDRGWTHDRLCLAYEVATIFFGDGAETSMRGGCAPQSVWSASSVVTSKTDSCCRGR
jgi:hypothetical protein